jgi:hypothetical protein
MANSEVTFKYREVNFDEPVTFSSNLAKGYKINNKLRLSSNETLTVQKLLTRMGKKGWELMSINNNQYFLLKKRCD